MIRNARPEEFEELGQMIVQVYASLPGMPPMDEQPEYYDRLRNVGARAANAAIEVFTAIDAHQEVCGCVDFIADMQHYGSGGTAPSVPHSAGIRLLAVRPRSRQQGVGRALTEFCIQQAQQLGRSQLILHTTRAMNTAWRMYEAMGFVRYPEIDFQQGRLEVFGFGLRLQAGVQP